MGVARGGYLAGIAAYGLWGFFPLYLRLLRPASPLEILAHRIIWSVVFVGVVLLVGWRRRPADRRNWLPGRGRSSRPLLAVIAAAALISVNWGMYIYGVDTERVVETSLGYFINPLVTVLLGVLLLGERLRGPQWLAVGVGAVAVTVLTVDYGRLPYLALTLAGSFGLYGFVKKRLGLPPAEGLFAETLLLAGPALGLLWLLDQQGTLTFGTVSAGHTGLLLLAGAATSVPLLLFAGAANRIPLTALGILQYLTPAMQFGIGVLIFGEPMPAARLAGFGLVWCALTIFTVDMIRNARRRPVLVEG
ncbi:MAG TPA: EamA family transporter RarD [Natronosporangium sp.]